MSFMNQRTTLVNGESELCYSLLVINVNQFLCAKLFGSFELAHYLLFNYIASQA